MLDLVDILQEHRVSWVDSDHHHVQQGWIGVDCPRCSPGWHKYRLGFELATGRTNCWVCGLMDGPRVLAELCRISLRDALAIWGKLPRDRTAPKQRHTGVFKRPSGVQPMLPIHKTYLKRRGFDPASVAQVWGVQGIGPLGLLKWRLYIPIYDRYGVEVSWTTRSVRKYEPRRYWSASKDEESLPHKSLLYGAQLTRQAVVVHEGPLDAWAVGPGAVATCGTACTDLQLAAIASYPVRALCFDTNADAQRRARLLCRQLAAMPGVTENILLESAEDAAAADPDELAEIRSHYLMGGLQHA